MRKAKKNKPCHWCGRPAEPNKGSRAGMHLCEDCCGLFDYYSDERECFVCCSKDGLKKMRKSGLILCEKHRREQAKINQEKAVKKYAQARRASNLAPEQRKQITKAVLCNYFTDLKAREQELAPACVECGSIEDVVCVSTKGDVKLLCQDCRAKIYQRRRIGLGVNQRGRKRVRTASKKQCDQCENCNAKKVRNFDLYLCPGHYQEYYKQNKPAKEGRRCEKCNSNVRVRQFNGYWLCAQHVGELKLEKRKIPPLLRMFVIPYIRT